MTILCIFRSEGSALKFFIYPAEQVFHRYGHDNEKPEGYQRHYCKYQGKLRRKSCKVEKTSPMSAEEIDIIAAQYPYDHAGNHEHKQYRSYTIERKRDLEQYHKRRDRRKTYAKGVILRHRKVEDHTGEYTENYIYDRGYTGRYGFFKDIQNEYALYPLLVRLKRKYQRRYAYRAGVNKGELYRLERERNGEEKEEYGKNSGKDRLYDKQRRGSLDIVYRSSSLSHEP